ncbi:MAG: DMT family transporter, partial [Pseudomonadota bacterium]
AKSWIMIAILGLVWGGTFMVIELALPGITPFWLAAARIGFAAGLTLVIWRMQTRELWLTDASDTTSLVVTGVLSSALPFMLLSWGQQYVTSGFAGVSMAAVVLIVLPLAHFLTPGERMTPRRTIGFLIGFAGVVVLIGGQAFESTGSDLETMGRLACLGAASCYAVSSVMMRGLPPINPFGLAAMQLLIGACLVIPAAWIVEGPPPLPSTETILYLALLGLVPTAAANLLRILVIRSAGPVFMGLTNYQVPIWSVLLGAVFLNEPLPGSLLTALILILGGMGLSQYGALKRLFGKRA